MLTCIVRLMTALWMAELGVDTCIIDDKGTRALNGRADGFHVRTAEIWDSFGIHGVLQKFGVRFDEWCLWVCIIYLRKSAYAWF